MHLLHTKTFLYILAVASSIFAIKKAKAVPLKMFCSAWLGFSDIDLSLANRSAEFAMFSMGKPEAPKYGPMGTVLNQMGMQINPLDPDKTADGGVLLYAPSGTEDGGARKEVTLVYMQRQFKETLKVIRGSHVFEIECSNKDNLSTVMRKAEMQANRETQDQELIGHAVGSLEHKFRHAREGK